MSDQNMRFWLNFFLDAGIPQDEAVTYTLRFVENNMKKDMLMEVTKDLLSEMGITKVGDVICIIRHARSVYQKSACSNVLDSRPERETSTPTRVEAARPNPGPQTLASSPAARILGHLVRKYNSDESHASSKTEELAGTDRGSSGRAALPFTGNRGSSASSQRDTHQRTDRITLNRATLSAEENRGLSTAPRDVRRAERVSLRGSVFPTDDSNTSSSLPQRTIYREERFVRFRDHSDAPQVPRHQRITGPDAEDMNHMATPPTPPSTASSATSRPSIFSRLGRANPPVRSQERQLPYAGVLKNQPSVAQKDTGPARQVVQQARQRYLGSQRMASDRVTSSSISDGRVTEGIFGARARVPCQNVKERLGSMHSSGPLTVKRYGDKSQ